MCRNQEQYLKLSLTAKCGGLVYRPELKLVCNSMVPIDDYDELTEHFMECIKSELKSYG